MSYFVLVTLTSVMNVFHRRGSGLTSLNIFIRFTITTWYLRLGVLCLVLRLTELASEVGPISERTAVLVSDAFQLHFNKLLLTFCQHIILIFHRKYGSMQLDVFRFCVCVTVLHRKGARIVNSN